MSSIKEGRMHAIIWWMFHSLELVAKRVAKLLGFWIDMGPKAMDQEISWSFFRLKPWSLVEARHYSSFHQFGTKNFITFRRNQSIAIVSIALISWDDHPCHPMYSTCSLPLSFNGKHLVLHSKNRHIFSLVAKWRLNDQWPHQVLVQAVYSISCEDPAGSCL